MEIIRRNFKLSVAELASLNVFEDGYISPRLFLHTFVSDLFIGMVAAQNIRLFNGFRMRCEDNHGNSMVRDLERGDDIFIKDKFLIVHFPREIMRTHKHPLSR
jgi:hypothetical protein